MLQFCLAGENTNPIMRYSSNIGQIYRQPLGPDQGSDSTAVSSPQGSVNPPSPPNTEGQAQAKSSAASRSLDIIEAVAMAERPLTPAELCARLALPKATVHRLCATLEQRGLLEASANGRGLLPGRGLYRLATGVFASMPFQAERHVILQACLLSWVKPVTFRCRATLTCCISIVLRRIGRSGCSFRSAARCRSTAPLRAVCI